MELGLEQTEELYDLDERQANVLLAIHDMEECPLGLGVSTRRLIYIQTRLENQRITQAVRTLTKCHLIRNTGKGMYETTREAQSTIKSLKKGWDAYKADLEAQSNTHGYIFRSI